jgi:hypothetical protein
MAAFVPQRRLNKVDFPTCDEYQVRLIRGNERLHRITFGRPTIATVITGLVEGRGSSVFWSAASDASSRQGADRHGVDAIDARVRRKGRTANRLFIFYLG